MANLSKSTRPKTSEHELDNDWTLTPDQTIFMLQHHNAISDGYRTDDLTLLRELAASTFYLNTFGEMGWDEAYDRYEHTLNAHTHTRWHLEITPQACGNINGLASAQEQRAVLASISELLLADNPTTLPHVRELVGLQYKDYWRLTQGDYRILFAIIHWKTTHFGYKYKGTVEVLAVVHRGEAY